MQASHAKNKQSSMYTTQIISGPRTKHGSEALALKPLHSNPALRCSNQTRGDCFIPYNEIFNLSMVSSSVDSKSFGNSTYTSSDQPA